MTALTALVRKDLILFISDRRALLVSLLLPIVIGTFFGYLFGGGSGGGKRESGKIEVALVQLDAGKTGAALAAGLAANPALAISAMSLDEARAQVRKGKQKAAIVIPAGFGGAAKPEITLLYDPSQQAVLSMVRGMLTQQAMQALSGGVMTPSRTPFATREEAVSAASGVQGYNSYAHSFAGMGVQFILFMGVDIGIGILLAQRSGIFNRLLAAPVSLGTVLLARAFSAALIAAGILFVMFAFAVLVLGVEIGNPLGFAGVVLAFSLLTAAFGLFIAAFGKTPEAARGIAVFATLLMVMLGGAWVPSFMFPPWVQQAAMAVPTWWAIDGLDAMTWRGLGMDAALRSIGAQLGFTAVFGLLALWKFRRSE